ncbi:MFS transporter [Streptomyces sp. NPDC090994]|uniref:MFS transporter n=1 Tax=Streptomyces sp. NPDC090994 TaxID=3365969 RepID=UPI003827AEBC
MNTRVADGPQSRGQQVKWILGGSIGNFIEWYDWIIFALLAPAFAGYIFPSDSEATSVMLTYLTFAAGFLVRPLSAVVLSPYGDQYGRRKLLSLTIVLMGAGSLIIALTPAHDSIGVLAPVLVVTARVIQGIATGAEFQAGSTYVVEQAPPRHRGLAGSIIYSGTAVAKIAGTGIAALSASLAPGVLPEAWAWRVPFLLGAVFSLYALYVRFRTPESPEFEAAKETNSLVDKPLRALFASHKGSMLRVFLLVALECPFTIWTTFLPTYMHLTGDMPLDEALLGGTLSLVVFFFALPLAGALSDRIGRKPLLLVTAVGFLLYTYPALRLLDGASFGTFVLIDSVGCVLLAATCGPLPTVLSELFPTEFRMSGIGLPYAAGVAVFGGTAPLIATAFIDAGHTLWVGFYVTFVALLMVVNVATIRETGHTRKAAQDAVPPAPAPEQSAARRVPS